MSSLRANDPGSNAVFQTKRIANRKYPFPHLKFFRVSQRRCREIFFRINLDDSDIRFCITSDKLGLELSSIGQPDHYLIGVLHDMIIG